MSQIIPLLFVLWIWKVWKRREKLQKFEYLENKKSFFDEIKNIFHSFWRAIIWWKNKKLIKIADTSFKTFFFSKAFKNPFVKPKPNNKEFMQSSWQQQLLTCNTRSSKGYSWCIVMSSVLFFYLFFFIYLFIF